MGFAMHTIVYLRYTLYRIDFVHSCSFTIVFLMTSVQQQLPCGKPAEWNLSYLSHWFQGWSDCSPQFCSNLCSLPSFKHGPDVPCSYHKGGPG